MRRSIVLYLTVQLVFPAMGHVCGAIVIRAIVVARRHLRRFFLGTEVSNRMSLKLDTFIERTENVSNWTEL
jgi:hypothetical protein